jgi:hypothetical protein
VNEFADIASEGDAVLPLRSDPAFQTRASTATVRKVWRSSESASMKFDSRFDLTMV